MEATLRTHKLHDLSHFGLRITAGVLFIVHSLGKFQSGTEQFFVSVGIPAEMTILIGLLELIGGSLLVVGVLTRIASSLFAIEMLVVITYVKKLHAFSGGGGFEIDLLALSIVLTIIVLGPGRISISHVVKKLPRFLQ